MISFFQITGLSFPCFDPLMVLLGHKERFISGEVSAGGGLEPSPPPHPGSGRAEIWAHGTMWSMVRGPLSIGFTRQESPGGLGQGAGIYLRLRKVGAYSPLHAAQLERGPTKGRVLVSIC